MHAPPLALGASPGLARRTLQWARSGARRALQRQEANWSLTVVALALVVLVLSLAIPSDWPLAAYMIPLGLSSSVLSLARTGLVVALIAVCVAISMSVVDRTALRWITVLLIAVMAAIVVQQARRRSALGLTPGRGGSMLVDLRDRLASQGRLPVLPHGWRADAVVRSAGGASFAGDFVVAAKTASQTLLEVVVVDVSGKGIDAGTRSLQLSGAFGGLLGALPPGEFLAAANEYLLRQEWPEGFATAIHLAVNLRTGDFEVRSAGHPPAVQFHAGSGRWSVLWTEGPLLGVATDAAYGVHEGVVQPGDALLLYTDGLVESPQRDIIFGIDKLVGEADRLVQQGFERGAERLVRTIESDNDDRALLLLHRA